MIATANPTRRTPAHGRVPASRRRIVVMAAVTVTALAWPATASAGPAPVQQALATPTVAVAPMVAPAGPYTPRMVTLWVTGTNSASVTWRRPKAGSGITGYRVGMSVQYPDGYGGWGAWTGWQTKMFGASVRRVALSTRTPGLRIRVGVQARYSTGWGGTAVTYATLDGPAPDPTPTDTPTPTESTTAPTPTQSTTAPVPTQSTSTPTPEDSTTTPTTDCSQYPEGSLDWILCNHDPSQ